MKSITKEFLESEIVNVKYTRLTGTLTHCAITVKSGFTFTGESACVDEASFNKELGEKYAFEQAFEKMWLPYGFWLKQKTGGTPIDRMQVEADDLDEKLLKLEAFVAKGKPDFLTDEEWSLLNQQAEYMVLYRDTLESRLEIAKEKQEQS